MVVMFDSQSKGRGFNSRPVHHILLRTNDRWNDRRWITTWNYYLGDLKYLFRWLHNFKIKE